MNESTAEPDPLAPYLPDHPHACWWVFHWGGLLNSRWAEDPPLAHVVNVGLGSQTLCGRERFGEGVPGGGAGPSLDRLGGLQPRPGEPRVQPCPECLTKLPELDTFCAMRGFRMSDYVRASGV